MGARRRGWGDCSGLGCVQAGLAWLGREPLGTSFLTPRANAGSVYLQYAVGTGSAFPCPTTCQRPTRNLCLSAFCSRGEQPVKLPVDPALYVTHVVNAYELPNTTASGSAAAAGPASASAATATGAATAAASASGAATVKAFGKVAIGIKPLKQRRAEQAAAQQAAAAAAAAAAATASSSSAAAVLAALHDAAPREAATAAPTGPPAAAAASATAASTAATATAAPHRRLVLDMIAYDSLPALGAAPLPEQAARMKDPEAGCRPRWAGWGRTGRCVCVYVFTSRWWNPPAARGRAQGSVR